MNCLPLAVKGYEPKRRWPVVNWQGDVARGKRGLRRSRYAEMVSMAEYWKVEEHEPVHPHLRAEMSPPPTRLNRRNADDAPQHVGRGHPNAGVNVWRLAMGHGENAARPWHRHRLAESKGKDCDRHLTNTLEVRHMNEGRHGWNAKGVGPDVHHAGRVPVVVRGGESPSHIPFIGGEGEQFELLGVQNT